MQIEIRIVINRYGSFPRAEAALSQDTLMSWKRSIAALFRFGNSART
jgi:hypothetical protein